MKTAIPVMIAGASAGHRAPKARFTDLSGSLLPLFADPDARGGRCWEEVFGLGRAQREPMSRVAGAVHAVSSGRRR